MGTRAQVAAIAVVAISACHLFIDPDKLVADTGSSSSLDAAADGTGDRDAEAAEGAADAGDGDAADASGCDASPPDGAAGEWIASHAVTPIVVDGVLDEWACIPFARVDSTNGVVVKPNPATPTPPNTFEFAVAWTPDALLVAFRVVDPSADGDAAAPGQFRNDAVEVYVDGDGMVQGAYGPDDHQWIVDHHNQASVFQNSAGVPPSAAFTSAVREYAGGFSVEVRIGIADLGLTQLSSGAKLGFDVGIDEGDGQQQLAQLLWYRAPSCSCTSGCCCGVGTDEPFCNTQRFGILTVAP